MSQWNSTLTRRAPMRRKPLKAVHPSLRHKLEGVKPKKSKPTKQRQSRRRQESEYTARQRVWKALPENELCIACVRRREAGENITLNFTDHCHHFRGKIGRLLNDERFWLPVCARCHNWIHFEHPAQARELRLLAGPAEWNVYPGPSPGPSPQPLNNPTHEPPQPRYDPDNGN